jgi:hypothetical protein
MMARDHPVQDMIAQPTLTIPAAKPQAAAQQPQAPANGNGFLSLLTATDPALTDLTQNIGAITPSAANSNKPAKTSVPTAAAATPTATTPYVAVPAATAFAAPAATTPAAPAATIPAAAAAAAPTAAAAAAALTTATVTAAASNILPPADVPTTINGAAIPNNVLLPAPSAPAPTAGQTPAGSANQTATNAAPATTNGSATTGNGNSTALGAGQVDARVAVGAPIFASQPNATMATVSPHLLDAAAPHPQPGAVPDKPGDGAAAAKPGTAASTAPATAPDTANTPAPPAPSALTHAAASDQSNSFTNGNNDSDADNNASAATNGSDAAPTAATPLVAQPNAPLATPLQTDAAVHTAAPYVPVGEQVALNLKQALAADNNEIRIQLKPASLGTIDVKLNLTDDGRVSAVISADRSDTLNMLKQDSGTLQQGLRDAGFNADNSSLSFSLRGDAQSFAQNSWQGGGGQSGGSAAYYRASANGTLGGAASVGPAQRFHSGTLDIEV